MSTQALAVQAGCLPTWMPCSPSSSGDGENQQTCCSKLKDRVSDVWKMAPAIFLLATSIMGIVCSFIFSCHWLAIPFAAAAVTSTVLIYNLKEMKSFAESNELLRANNQTLQTRITELEEQLSRLGTQIDELETARKALSKENALYKEQNEALGDNVAKVTKQAELLKEETTTYAAQNKALGEQVTANKKQADEYATKYAESLKEIKGLKEDAATQVESLKLLGTSLGALQEGFSGDGTTLKKHLQTFAEELGKLSQVKSSHSALSDQMATNLSSLSTLVQQLSLDTQLSTLTEIHKKIGEAQGEAKATAKALQKAQEGFEGLLTSFKEKVTQLGEEKEDLRTLKDDLKSQLEQVSTIFHTTVVEPLKSAGVARKDGSIPVK